MEEKRFNINPADLAYAVNSNDFQIENIINDARNDARSDAQKKQNGDEKSPDRIINDTEKLLDKNHNAATGNTEREKREKRAVKSVDLSLDQTARGKRAHGKAQAELAKMRKRSRIRYIVTNVILSVALVLSSVTFVGATMLNSKLLKSGTIDQEEKGSFANLVSSTNENVSYFLVCGVDLSEDLTDVIMVVCYDLANNQVNVLQIPRDSYVGEAYNSGKINAVYGSAKNGESKIKALIRCINKKFGLPIDHYATVTIKGTEKIIDIAGSVDIRLERDFHLVDDTTNPQQKKTFSAGDVHFDGQWGTAFIRHRASYDAGDTARVRAQRKFYAAFMKKMISLDFGQITNIITQCTSQISTDLTLGQMLGYAQKMKNLKLQDVSIVTVPGQADEYHAPTGYASYFSVHKSELVKLLNDQFRPYEAKALTTDDLDLTELADQNTNDYEQILQGGTLNEFDTEQQTTTAQSNDD